MYSGIEQMISLQSSLTSVRTALNQGGHEYRLLPYQANQFGGSDRYNEDQILYYVSSLIPWHWEQLVQLLPLQTFHQQ